MIDYDTRARFHKYVDLLAPLIFANKPIDAETGETVNYNDVFDGVRKHAWQLALEPDESFEDVWHVVEEETEPSSKTE